MSAEVISLAKFCVQTTQFCPKLDFFSWYFIKCKKKPIPHILALHVTKFLFGRLPLKIQ